MPCYLDLIVIILELVVIALVCYTFLLITILTMLNIFIFGGFIVAALKIWKVLEKMRVKVGHKYQTKDFNKYMKKQHAIVYSKMEIPLKLDWEKEGRWIQISLEQDDTSFE